MEGIQTQPVSDMAIESIVDVMLSGSPYAFDRQEERVIAVLVRRCKEKDGLLSKAVDRQHEYLRRVESQVKEINSLMQAIEALNGLISEAECTRVAMNLDADVLHGQIKRLNDEICQLRGTAFMPEPKMVPESVERYDELLEQIHDLKADNSALAEDRDSLSNDLDIAEAVNEELRNVIRGFAR